MAKQARMSVQAKMGAEEALFLEDYGGLTPNIFYFVLLNCNLAA